MFDTISTYLESHATPEQKQVCLAGCQSLVDAGITDHVDILSDEIAAIDSTSLDTGDLMISIIHGLLTPMHRNALSEFGIILADETTLAMASDILTAVHGLGNYGDPASLNALCDAPEGAQEALADMLELTGAYTSAEYLGALQSVSPELIDRIELITRTDDAGVQPPVEIVREARLRLLKWLSLPQVAAMQDLQVRQYLRDGGRLGLRAYELLPLFHDKLQDLSGQRIADELFGLVLATETPYDFIETTIKHELERVTGDLDKINVAAARIPSLLKQVF